MNKRNIYLNEWNENPAMLSLNLLLVATAQRYSKYTAATVDMMKITTFFIAIKTKFS